MNWKIISLIILMMISPLYGQSTDITQKPTSYWLSGNPDKDAAWNWMKETDNNIFGNMGTGKTFYVDSGVNIEGDGLTMDSAFDTMVEGFNAMTADRGDRLYVAQGHNEDGVVGTAVMWQASVSGVTVIGLGNGSLTPTWDFNYSSNTCTVTADNVWLHNLRFRPSLDAVAIGLEVTSGSDYPHITKCEFGYAETSTDEFAIALKVGTSTGAIVEYNLFDSGAQAGVAAITIDGTQGMVIRTNTIRGDSSTSHIHSAVTLSTDLLIEDNILWQGDTAALNAQPVWELITGTSGISRRNYCAANVTFATAFVGDGMMNFGNHYTEATGGAYTAFNLDHVQATTTSVIVSPDD